MATIKVIFRGISRNSREGALSFRVIHRRKTRHINSGLRILHDEWDESMAIAAHASSQERDAYLASVNSKLNDGISRLSLIIDTLDKAGAEYSADDIVTRFNAADTIVGFISFARTLIASLRQMGRTRLSEHYATALNSLLRFNGDSEIPFRDFDADLMARYETHLSALGLSPNTTSYYMRNLRAIYNRAAEQLSLEPRNPFRHVYTGIAKTAKRALPLDCIKAIRKADTDGDPVTELARDVFLFCFCTRGMAIIDVANLRKGCLKGNSITYRRQKTGRLLTIRWEPQMREIASRHADNDSDFIFPIIDSRKPDYRRQFLTAYNKMSRHLKKLGRQLGLPDPLTFHRARHSWASIARENNVPLSIISEGMGHDSEKTTAIYLASLEAAAVDNANSEILSLLDT